MNPIEKPVFLEIKLVLIIAHNSIKNINYFTSTTVHASSFSVSYSNTPSFSLPSNAVRPDIRLDPGLSSRSLCSSNDEAAPNESLTTHPKQRQGP